MIQTQNFNAAEHADNENAGDANINNNNHVIVEKGIIGERDPIYVIISGFIANFMVFGITFTFGIFQEFYLNSGSEGPLKNASNAAVAMIGTTAAASTYCFAIFNSLAIQHLKSPRLVMAIGSFIMTLGLILASICKKDQTYQFILSQGVLFGIGSSMVYIPPVVCAPPFFTRHRAIALGVLFSGTGMGALAMAPITKLLISRVGWRWGLRVLGLLNLCLTQIACFLVRQHPTLKGRNKSNKISLSKKLNYKAVDSWCLVLQLAAGLFQAAGYLICLNYMSAYSVSLGFTSNQGANFIAINNGINAMFKVIIGYFADKVGRLKMIVFCSFISSSTVFGLWYCGTRETFISFVVLYGVFSGAIISLLPTCLSEIFGLKNYQSISGLMYFFRGLGNLLGSPIAGILISNSGTLPKDYQGAILYNGALLAVSAFLLIALGVRVKKILPKDLQL